MTRSTVRGFQVIYNVLSNNDRVTRTTYGDLANGDIVSIQGFGFVVYGVHREATRPSVVRFHGGALDASLVGTGYDGGVYGANADELVLAVKGGAQ